MAETPFQKIIRLEKENRFLWNQAVLFEWRLDRCEKELQRTKRQRDLAEAALSCYRIQVSEVGNH